MKNIFAIIIILMAGCTTVRYNGTDTFVKEVDYPEVGKAITVYVGDHMVQKGTITEESVLLVHKTIDGAFYDIPAKKYPQVGYDQKQDFYSAVGVVRGGLSDPIQALALKKEEGAELCVVPFLAAMRATRENMSVKSNFQKGVIAINKR